MKGNLSRLKSIAAVLQKRNLTITAAESCTGGGLAFALTRVSGSSSWFKQSWITYSVESKTNWLGVSLEAIAQGAVSEACAKEMAICARESAVADFAISITGVAGPTGGTDAVPVGTVWIGFSWAESTQAFCFHFPGDRNAVREGAIEAALRGLEWWLQDRLTSNAFQDFKRHYSRVFLAAWPSPATQSQLLTVQSKELAFLEKLHRSEDLHMTVRFLGDLSVDQLEKVHHALQGLYWPEMEIEFSQLAYWRHSQAWVVLPRMVPSVLLSAVGAIEARLEKCDLPRDGRFFLPHITLARGKGVDADYSMAIPPITFATQDLALASANGDGPMKYQKLHTVTE